MIVSIAEIIKEEGLDIVVESFSDNRMGEIQNDTLIYNKNHNSKADLKVILAVMLVLFRQGKRGQLQDLFKFDGKFIDNVMQEAVDIVLPQEIFTSGEPIYWKQHKINIDTINLQRQRWKDIEEPQPAVDAKPIDQFIDDDDISEFL